MTQRLEGSGWPLHAGRPERPTSTAREGPRPHQSVQAPAELDAARNRLTGHH